MHKLKLWMETHPLRRSDTVLLGHRGRHILYCILQKRTAALRLQFISAQNIWHINTHTHTHTHKHTPTCPHLMQVWNETAMTTVHKCATFHRACSGNQKGQTNTVHNTGGLNELQAAKAREAKLDLPLGPNMNTAARHPDFHHMDTGTVFLSLWNTPPSTSSSWYTVQYTTGTDYFLFMGAMQRHQLLTVLPSADSDCQQIVDFGRYCGCEMSHNFSWIDCFSFHFPWKL